MAKWEEYSDTVIVMIILPHGKLSQKRDILYYFTIQFHYLYKEGSVTTLVYNANIAITNDHHCIEINGY